MNHLWISTSLKTFRNFVPHLHVTLAPLIFNLPHCSFHHYIPLQSKWQKSVENFFLKIICMNWFSPPWCTAAPGAPACMMWLLPVNPLSAVLLVCQDLTSSQQVKLLQHHTHDMLSDSDVWTHCLSFCHAWCCRIPSTRCSKPTVHCLYISLNAAHNAARPSLSLFPLSASSASMQTSHTPLSLSPLWLCLWARRQSPSSTCQHREIELIIICVYRL